MLIPECKQWMSYFVTNSENKQDELSRLFYWCFENDIECIKCRYQLSGFKFYSEWKNSTMPTCYYFIECFYVKLIGSENDKKNY